MGSRESAARDAQPPEPWLQDLSGRRQEAFSNERLRVKAIKRAVPSKVPCTAKPVKPVFVKRTR